MLWFVSLCSCCTYSCRFIPSVSPNFNVELKKKLVCNHSHIMNTSRCVFSTGRHVHPAADGPLRGLLVSPHCGPDGGPRHQLRLRSVSAIQIIGHLSYSNLLLSYKMAFTIWTYYIRSRIPFSKIFGGTHFCWMSVIPNHLWMLVDQIRNYKDQINLLENEFPLCYTR